VIGENNEPYKAKQIQKLENAKKISQLFAEKEIDWYTITDTNYLN
jgi:hypothetical protein